MYCRKVHHKYSVHVIFALHGDVLVSWSALTWIHRLQPASGLLQLHQCWNHFVWIQNYHPGDFYLCTTLDVLQIGGVFQSVIRNQNALKCQPLSIMANATKLIHWQLNQGWQWHSKQATYICTLKLQNQGNATSSKFFSIIPATLEIISTVTWWNAEIWFCSTHKLLFL